MGIAKFQLGLKGRHGLHMLGLIVTNSYEDIVQVVYLWPADITGSSLEGVKHIQVL